MPQLGAKKAPTSAIPRVPPMGYEKIKAIGSGNFGDCYLIRRQRDSKQLVCKVVRNPTGESFDQTEITILKDLGRHDRIVRLLDYRVDRFGVQIIMEYCSGGTLARLIDDQIAKRRVFQESFVRHVFRQLIEALAFLHENVVARGVHCVDGPRTLGPIVHRDVKPENIFLRTPFNQQGPHADIVLGDFGCAEVPFWSRRGDVWAVGAIIHLMCHHAMVLTPKPPVDSQGEWIDEPWVRQPIPLGGRWSADLNNKMMSALAPKDQRPTSQHLLRMFWYRLGLVLCVAGSA